MTTATPPITPIIPADSWRDRFKVTRLGVFSVLALLAGVWMVFGISGGYAPETITRLTFGAQLPDIQVPTQAYVMALGILYLVGGVVGLLPVPSLHRVKLALLIVGGLMILPTVIIIAAAGQSTNVTVLLSVSFRLATPIAMGALAGIWCERSGVVNIAIEGMMLTGACFGFVGATLLSPYMASSTALWVGVLIAVLSGGLMSLLHAWLSITFKTDQVISGTVINILAIGLTSFMRRDVLLSSDAGRETLPVIPIIPELGRAIGNLPGGESFNGLVAQIADGVNNLPIIGDIIHLITSIINEVFLTGRPVFYSMLILLVVTHVVLFYTRWGLRTRAVGENPHAADTLGINVIRNRWINVFIGGLIAGLAGAWFSLETTGSFDDGMTSGRGFIALAAMIFGKYTPLGAFGGAVLFGFSDALGARFQFLGVAIPPQFLQMVPYIITIIVLAGLVGRAVGPKATGKPYEKEGK